MIKWHSIKKCTSNVTAWELEEQYSHQNNKEQNKL
jgi:hypothetical protein